jgi:hypothetical protein
MIKRCARRQHNDQTPGVMVNVWILDQIRMQHAEHLDAQLGPNLLIATGNGDRHLALSIKLL